MLTTHPIFKLFIKYYLLFYLFITIIFTVTNYYLVSYYKPNPGNIGEDIIYIFPALACFLLGMIYPKKFWLGVLVLVLLNVTLSSITDWISPPEYEHNLGPLVGLLGLIVTLLFYLVLAGIGALLGIVITQLIKRYYPSVFE